MKNALAFVLAFCLSMTSGLTQPYQVDVLTELNCGDATITTTNYDLGNPLNCFDGDTQTIFRSANINPAYVQVAFTEAISISKLRVYVGQNYGGDESKWWVDAADNQDDMTNETGSFVHVVLPRIYDGGSWDESVLTTTVSAKIFRFTVERTQGDNYVHFWELEMWSDALAPLFAPAPTGLTANPFSTTVQLDWDPYTTEFGGYHLYRSQVSGQYNDPPRYIGKYDTYTDYGLQAGTQYFYKISAFHPCSGESNLSTEIAVQTDQNPYLEVASLDILVAIYAGDMTPAKVTEIRNGLALAREFFYRNSLGKLNLNLDIQVFDAVIQPYTQVIYDPILADLTTRGMMPGQYDAVYTYGSGLPGNYGGFLLLSGTTGGSFSGFYEPNRVPISPGPDGYTGFWLFTHEFGHTLDLLAAHSGFSTEMLSNHFSDNYPLPPSLGVFDAGTHFDGMANILRLFEHYMDFAPPWDGYLEVLDADGDGMADLDDRMPMDEQRFGSSAGLVDSDGDLLSDLDEFVTGIFAPSNPNLQDTDGDGILDGSDPFSLINLSSEIPMMSSSPTIDGIMGNQEDWQLAASDPFYDNLGSLTMTMYNGWDNDYLYFAFSSNQELAYFLGLDGSGENGTFESSVRFTSGDYSSINNNSFGDCYNEDAYLRIRPYDPAVSLKGQPVAGSQVVTQLNGGLYFTEVRIPHDIGPGRGYHYVAPEVPIVQTMSFGAGDILGLELLAIPLSDDNVLDEWIWKNNASWMSMFETGHYYDVALIQGQTESFTLINGHTDEELGPIQPGATLDLTSLPTSLLDIQAHNIPANVDRVRFTLHNTPINREDLSAPYRMARETRKGYLFSPGAYILVAELKNGPSTIVETRTLNFTVVNSPEALTGFSLVNAKDDYVVGPLTDGDVIDLATVGTHKLNIIAHTAPENIGSVDFDLRGDATFDQYDNQPPYCMARDNQNGGYYQYLFSPGSYTLTATPYTQYMAGGDMGTPMTINFTVVNSGARMAIPDKEFMAYPNPTTGKLNLQFVNVAGGDADLQVFDMQGRLIQFQTLAVQPGSSEQGIGVYDLSDGIYLLTCRIGHERYTTQFVKR